MKGDDTMITRKDILDYAKEHGNDSAYGLLLLAGPDGFGGTYEEYNSLLRSLSGDDPGG